MKYLFYLTIGPVQPFIGQSRKTQDIYAGSRLLSSTIETAALLFTGTIIYPHFPKQEKGKNTSAPNRFCGILETGTPRSVAESLENQIRAHFVDELRKGVMTMDRKAVYTQSDLNKIQGFEEQLSQHLEIYWAFEVLEEDYPAAHRRLLRKILGVKALRSFNQYSYQTSTGEKGRKCSLDGERNVKFYRLNFTEHRQKDTLPDKLFTSAAEVEVLDFPNLNPPPTLRHLQPGEGLSAVSFAKRCWGNTAYTFPSTAEIALSRVALEFKGDFAAFTQLIKQKLGVNPQDCWQLFMEENLNEAYIKKNLGAEEFEAWQEHSSGILNAHAELVQKIRNNQLEQTRYYAVVSFDGDDMGRWWQGKFLREGQQGQLQEFQSDLAKALQGFGQWANTELFKPEDGMESVAGGDDLTIIFRGKTVYAGGDDYLGFANLDFLWDTLDALQKQFDEFTQPVLDKYELDRPLTFSAGISIAHYKEPLQRVLSHAQNVQKKAKSADDNKNKLGISVLKHSGEMHEAILDKSGTTNMKDLVNQLQTGYSDTFIKRLQAKYWPLIDNNGRLQGEHTSNLFLQELEKWYANSRKRADVIEGGFETVMNIYRNAYLKGSNNARNFIHALHVANFIAIKANQL